ncbi:MAG: hypothetical protein JSV20_07755 [Candidatus Bathyarchaeota archaeon]|nr:MAG: hypothetical protein JSV20_07755 [Candidatus Bathyarchaeota archaeon]
MFRLTDRKEKIKKKKRLDVKTSVLGTFTNFPAIIHGLAIISHRYTIYKMQKATIQALCDLNGYRENRNVSRSNDSNKQENCLFKISFEIGVANGVFFDYLNEKNAKRIIKAIRTKKKFSLDFLVIITYHYIRMNKKIPLRFDHHLLRFRFYKEKMEVLLFNSKGIRRMSLEDLLNKITNKIYLTSKSIGLQSITIEQIKTL